MGVRKRSALRQRRCLWVWKDTGTATQCSGSCVRLSRWCAARQGVEFQAWHFSAIPANSCPFRCTRGYAGEHHGGLFCINLKIWWCLPGLWPWRWPKVSTQVTTGDLGDITLLGEASWWNVPFLLPQILNSLEKGSSEHPTYKIKERRSKKSNYFLNTNSSFQLSIWHSHLSFKAQQNHLFVAFTSILTQH